MTPFTKVMEDLMGIDLSVYKSYKIDAAAGLILVQGMLPNGAVVVTRYFTKIGGMLERYESHKRFPIETRNQYIVDAHKANVGVGVIAQMMQLSSTTISKFLKEIKNE